MKRVVGLMDNYGDARDVADDLANEGVEADAVHILKGEKSRREDRAGMWERIESFFGAGTPEEDVNYYAEGLNRKGVVVAADVPDDLVKRAAQIMKEHGAVDIDQRVAEWKQSGWKVPETGRGREFPAAEQEVKISKRDVSTGGVRVYSRVIETPIEEDEGLKEERAKVKRGKTKSFYDSRGKDYETYRRAHDYASYLLPGTYSEGTSSADIEKDIHNNWERRDRLGKVSDLIGSTVKNNQNQSIAKINNMMVDRQDGKIGYVILSSGGYLSIGNKERIAVPWSAFKVGSDGNTLILHETKKKLEQAPRFSQDEWPNMSDTKWVQEVNNYFKTSATGKGQKVDIHN